MKNKRLTDAEVARQARPGESWEQARYRLECSPWPRQMRPCVNNRGTGELGDCWNWVEERDGAECRCCDSVRHSWEDAELAEANEGSDLLDCQ